MNKMSFFNVEDRKVKWILSRGWYYWDGEDIRKR
jgi:hypothetical protein